VPFFYDIKVPDLDEGRGGKYTFVKWLLSGKSDVAANTAFAIVKNGETRYLLRNSGPGFFTPWKVEEGEEISAGQAIGRITTDGELIPYGRPYVTFSELPPVQS